MGRAIDPRLNFLLERHREQTLAELRSSGRFGLSTPRRQAASVRVLLRFKGESLEPLEREGFRPATVAGDVATGSIELDRLEDLASLPEVVHMEASRPLTGELETSVREIGADRVHAGTDLDSPDLRGSGLQGSGPLGSGLRGAGVLVGIIDTGLDYLHENFIAPDGSSRIVAIWDQALEPEGAELSPEGFGYGVEYSKAEIDRSARPSRRKSCVTGTIRIFCRSSTERASSMAPMSLGSWPATARWPAAAQGPRSRLLLISAWRPRPTSFLSPIAPARKRWATPPARSTPAPISLPSPRPWGARR